MEAFVRDLRFAQRMLISRPGFTILAVVCLALGIGASAAIFSVVNGVLLKPLHFPQADRLVAWGSGRGKADVGALSPPDFVDMRAQAKQLDGAVYTEDAFSFRSNELAVQLRGARVSSNFFRVLGVSPKLGRDFTSDEELPHRGQSVLIGYGAWQKQFGGDPKIIGKSVRLDADNYTVVGVMPAGVNYPIRSVDMDIWVPLTLAGDSTFEGERGAHYLTGIGRLASGVTIGQAKAEMQRIVAGLTALHPASDANRFADVVELQSTIVKGSRTSLIMLAGAVAFLLLIACANVANLMLARSALRAKEVAVRTAIGATRRVILKQVLTESVLLALVGGVLGLILAVWGTDLLLAIAPRAIPRVHDIALDWGVVGFTAFVTIGTGLLFGIAPALQLSSADLTGTLKDGGRSVTGSGAANGTRSVLVIAEVALSLVLLAGAGLLSTTLIRLQHVDPGFDTHNLVTAGMSLPAAKYKTDRSQTDFYERMYEKIRATPGVLGVAAVSIIPLDGSSSSNSFALENEPHGENVAPTHGEAADQVSTDFFKVMEIPLKAGRVFTAQDDSGAPPVIIVNEAFAKKYWPGENPLGKGIYPGDTVRRVIGVVGNVHRDGLDRDAAPEMYTPQLQWANPNLSLIVRTRDNAANVPAAMERALASLDPDQSLNRVRPMEVVLESSLARQRFTASLLGIFAAVALALSAVGIFGVMTAMVTQRTRELAVRLALGAHPRKVLHLVMSHGASLAGIGILIGLFGAFALGRVVAGLLYNVGASDPATLLCVSLLLAAVALLACYIPARRATRLDPIITLREE